MNEETERELLEYLAEGRVERIRLTERLDKSIEASGRILHELELHEQKDESRFDDIKGVLRGHDARIDELEARTEETRNQKLNSLRVREQEHKAGESWMKRFLAQTVVTIGIAIMTGIAGALLTMLLQKGH